MNHLCGLVDSTSSTSSSDDAVEFWSSLSNYEVEELRKFRIAYEKLRPTTTSSAKNTSTTTTSSISSRSTTTIPQFLVSTDDLFECGWRPLDDITLYRFLCADVVTESRGNKKTFQLSKSLDRLQRALQFRKDKRVDDLLHDIVVISSTMKECGGGGGGNKPRRKNNSCIMSPPSSFSRMASGSLSPCGNHIENIQINVVEEIVAASSTPKTNKKLLLHRNTTETTTSLSESSSSSSVSGDDDGSNTSGILVGTTNITGAFPATPNNNTILKDLDKYQRLRVRVFTGRDYQQQPVMFERLGEFLGSGNCIQFSDEEWCQFYIWDLERHFVEMRNSALAEAKKRRRGGNKNSNKNLPIITKYTFCGDCSGIVSSIFNGSIWNVVPLLKVLVRSVEDFYPEIAARIVLFNFPKVATVIYRAVKSFLDPVTASKISLHAGIPSAKVFDIPLDAIPKEYGGTSPVEYPKTASS